MATGLRWTEEQLVKPHSPEYLAALADVEKRTAEQRWPWLFEPEEVKQVEKQDYRYGTPLSARR